MADTFNTGYLLVFFATFLGIFSLIVGGLPAMFTGDNEYSYASQNMVEQGFSESFSLLYSFYDPTWGVNASDMSWGWEFSTPRHEFTHASAETVNVYCCSNDDGYGVYFFFKVDCRWGWWDTRTYFIMLDSIIGAYDNYANSSVIDLVFDKHVSLIVKNDTGVPMEDAINTRSHFTIYFAIDTIDQLQGIDAWGAFVALMTFRLPSIHPIVNIMIAIPIYTTTGYVIFRIVKSMIPTVGGGE